MTLGQTVNSRDFPNATTWEAVLKASLAKHPTCCPFGRSFANHLLNSGYEIQKTQHLLDHNDVKTTMVDTHVLYRGGKGVRSPADAL